MEGTLALLIPIISVAGFFAWLIAISPVGKAYAERLRGAGRAAPEREDLREAMEQVRREVAELAERVDFTERLLARARDAERVAPPADAAPGETRRSGRRKEST
ncbi:MAG TPA: hypothetical protein VEU55_08330 [Gemmatimonadales bacterium]|nr:hypothetical protein [Gemmatimonadales bacterium]